MRRGRGPRGFTPTNTPGFSRPPPLLTSSLRTLHPTPCSCFPSRFPTLYPPPFRSSLSPSPILFLALPTSASPTSLVHPFDLLLLSRDSLPSWFATLRYPSVSSFPTDPLCIYPIPCPPSSWHLLSPCVASTLLPAFVSSLALARASRDATRPGRSQLFHPRSAHARLQPRGCPPFSRCGTFFLSFSLLQLRKIERDRTNVGQRGEVRGWLHPLFPSVSFLFPFILFFLLAVWTFSPFGKFIFSLFFFETPCSDARATYLLRVDRFSSFLLLLAPTAFLSCCSFLYFIFKNLLRTFDSLTFSSPRAYFAAILPVWPLDTSTFTRASFVPAIDPTCPFDFYFTHRVCRCVGLDFPVAKLTYWFYLIFALGFALLPSTVRLSPPRCVCFTRFVIPVSSSRHASNLPNFTIEYLVTLSITVFLFFLFHIRASSPLLSYKRFLTFLLPV